MLSIDSKTTVLSSSINGNPIESKSTQLPKNKNEPWALNYYATPKEGITLALKVKASQSFTLRATDQSDGFPLIEGKAIKPRPLDMMPTAFGLGLSDSTLVSKSFTFPPQKKRDLILPG